jgi:predicted dehydrogenase
VTLLRATTDPRIAILGCGSIGRRHLRNLAALGCRDVLAYDPSQEAREVVQREATVAPVAALAEVWRKGPDVALITAPTNLHVELALEACRHGCHLFVEKPLSHSSDGLDELRAAADAAGLVTMVGCNMRFHPGPLAVKRLLEENTAGTPLAARIHTGSFLPRWRPGQDYRHSYSASPEWGGAILDCIHELDLVLWYFGPATLLAAAHQPAHSLGLETDGLAEILLRHNTGTLSSVHLNFVQRDYRRTCQVIGSEGTISWGFEGRQVRLYDPEGVVSRTIEEPREWEINRMYVDELRHFLKSVARGVPSCNPLSGGLASLELALAARSAGAKEGT